jgi:hypothetical protein
MQIKDIPNFANKLVVDKSILSDENTSLKVGFKYAIANVGYSWYYDSCAASQASKIVDFDFH